MQKAKQVNQKALNYIKRNIGAKVNKKLKN